MDFPVRLTRRTLLGAVAAAPALATPQSGGGLGLPSVWSTLGSAEVRTSGNQLTVATGAVERTWRWTGRGLATISLRNQETGHEWSAPGDSSADWSYPGLIDPSAPAILQELTARPVRFDPLTSDRIEVVAEVEHTDAKLLLEYVIWAYPGAPGLRTQLRVRALPGFVANRSTQTAPHAADSFSIAKQGLATRAIGYYNHTQRRNQRETEILREEPVRDGADWASVLCLQDGVEGLCLVKESHKCVNQQGVDTGAFHLTSHRVTNSGWGPSPQDFLHDRYRDCWACWTVLYRGEDSERQLAVKRFDRRRFPVDPQRDIYIMANTWGSGADKSESLAASDEQNILRQIGSAADLGIDVQQIDDGWQGDNQYESWELWAKRYPQGWSGVREAARKAGLDLGLWAAWTIDAQSLQQTFDEGGFRYYKIDFARLDTYDKLEALFHKMRSLVEHSGHVVRVNWDVTENPARVGYFFARDLGNIYLENRKPLLPEHVVYHPYLVLRDAWQVAKFTNLNRFQITVQNPERVNRDVSDAYLHNHPYTVAISLMGSPIFFQETHYYDERARSQIRPLLALYKAHRRRMYRGFVFPIGAEPDNASWTGFQNWDPETESGYLTIFREIGAEEPVAEIALRFAAGRRLRIMDLQSGIDRSLQVPPDGRLRFEIPQAPGFRFLRYELSALQ